MVWNRIWWFSDQYHRSSTIPAGCGSSYQYLNDSIRLRTWSRVSAARRRPSSDRYQRLTRAIMSKSVVSVNVGEPLGDHIELGDGQVHRFVAVGSAARRATARHTASRLAAGATSVAAASRR